MTRLCTLSPSRPASGESFTEIVARALELLLTGLPPFPADDSLTILHRHLHEIG